METEIRSIEMSEIRLEGDPTVPKIVGYAAIFNSMSHDLGGFREIVLPGAFAKSIKSGSDIRALLHHDTTQVLGRTKSGTLAIAEDSKGLKIEITPPITRSAQEAIESIRRGDIDQMSFGFRVRAGGDEVKKENGQIMRYLKDVELREVSIVTFAAYEATIANVRSIVDRVEVPIEQTLEIYRRRLRLLELA